MKDFAVKIVKAAATAAYVVGDTTCKASVKVASKVSKEDELAIERQMKLNALLFQSRLRMINLDETTERN